MTPLSLWSLVPGSNREQRTEDYTSPKSSQTRKIGPEDMIDALLDDPDNEALSAAQTLVAREGECLDEMLAGALADEEEYLAWVRALDTRDDEWFAEMEAREDRDIDALNGMLRTPDDPTPIARVECDCPGCVYDRATALQRNALRRDEIS
jgi:hypothetical protein